MEKATGFESAKALVVQYLEAYNDRARKIALLRYELGHVAQVSPNEMIDAMSFSHGDFSCMTPHTTKGTYYIASNYKEKTKTINESVIKEITGQLEELEQIQSRLGYYLSLLEEKEQLILRMHYLEGLPMVTVFEKLNMCHRTAYKVKKRGIETLAEMYEFTRFGVQNW